MPRRRSLMARAPRASSAMPMQAEISEQEIVRDAIERLRFGTGADQALRLGLRAPFLAVIVDDHAPALIEAQHGERRNQHRRGEQERRGAFVERSHPQPEMESDAAMDPGDDHHREHHRDPVWRPDPVEEEHLRIQLLMPVQRLAEPDADDMGDDQHRYAEAECKLERLDRLPAELPAFVERPDAEPGMHHAGGVEQDRDGEELPERGVQIDAACQRLQRDIAERMVEKMADQIGEQHHAADQADLSQADAADEGCQLFSG